MKAKSLFPLVMILALFFVPLVSAATTVTLSTPASSSELAIDSSKNFTATVVQENAESIDICKLQWRRRNEATFSDVSGSTVTNTSTNQTQFSVLYTVPKCFGSEHKFRASCTNGTWITSDIVNSAENTGLSCKHGDPKEVAEVFIDIVIDIGSSLKDFAAVLGILLFIVFGAIIYFKYIKK